MDTNTLRSQMMQLWKDTFHDNDQYISLVFDSYFDPELVEYELHQGKVVAALMGIPYTFGWTDCQLQGLYLCGLATRENFRNRNIMTQLLQRINKKAAERGYTFTFLIPANDGLRKYYYDRGYVNASYRIDNCYTSIHNFEQEYYSILNNEDERVAVLKKRYFSSIVTQKLDIKNSTDVTDTIRYIRQKEYDTQWMQLRHSERDLYGVIADNNISHGEIQLVKNKEGDITAVAIVEFDEETTLYVQRLYSSDLCSRYKLLEALRLAHHERSIVLREYPEESDRRALWTTATVAASGNSSESKITMMEHVYRISSHARPYLMAQVLHVDEILKFLAHWRGECKFSILVKDGKDDEVLQYKVSKGVLRQRTIDQESDPDVEARTQARSGLVISTKQLAEILFRRPSDDHVVMEAFDIPRFIINASLLLD